jgi:Bifunctional DNA primase/polymerase, N-terminal/Primase C terminal 1 (PriCT-1)
VLKTALTLAKRGLHVFPCRPHDKVPATPHGVKDATTDLEIIRQWWTAEPQYNIGLATGTASGVFVIDVDGADAELELRKLEGNHGPLPTTVEVITARGRHLYFKMPDVPVRNSASKVAPGIDVRASGGYTLAPPSIHPSGRAYAWSVDSGAAFADPPRWLLDKVADRTDGNGKVKAAPASMWRELIANGADEGTRDDSAARLTGYLLRHHVDVLMVHGLVHLWNAQRCRPPLPDEDIDRIIFSIAGREIDRRNGRAG